MEITQEDVGKEYLKELKEITQIRKSKRGKWGDSFLKEDKKDLLVMIESKIRRYRFTQDKEAKVDSLRDAVNYLIFLLIVEGKKK